MLKKGILIIFIININSIFGQNKDVLKLQKESLFKAEQSFANFKPLEAINYYHQVCFLDINSELGVKAKKRIDSILPICQKKELDKWIGEWVLKQLKTDRFSFEKIVITEGEIYFYNKENDNNASRKEIIRFTLPELQYPILNINRLRFSNNEVWSFYVEKIDEEIKLFLDLIEDSSGVKYFVLDERIMTKDTRLGSEKEMEEELRTYYIKKL